MKVIVEKIKETPGRVFITGAVIGFIFGFVFGMLYETKYGVFSEQTKNYIHERRMKDLDYLEKVVLIKKEIILSNQESKILTLEKLDSLFVKHLADGIK